MIKLLDAGFTRLRKNKLFLVLSLFTIIFAIFLIYTKYRDMVTYKDNVELESLMLMYSVLIGIVIAIFTSLFLGVEYSDGTIRNKITIGHKRVNIYLSNLIIITMTSIFSYILFLIIVTSIGIPLFGTSSIIFKELIMKILIVFVTIIAYASIFTFLAIIISNKTITAVVSIMLAFGLMISALTCFNILETPLYIQEARIINGETKMEKVPNPKYPSEKKKKICQYLLDINPAGQMYQVLGKDASNLKKFPLYSLGICGVFTSIGLVMFKKKELK